MTRLLIVGPPGAGKGTQAVSVAAKLQIPAISTGDIFRKNVSEQTPLGIEAKRFMDAGEYVPDSLTNELVKSRLAEPDTRNGFLLDGYPRTLDQVGFLDRALAEQGTELDAVIQLIAKPDEVVKRLLQRSNEQGRSDDTEEVIRHRLMVYANQTEPLIDLYTTRDLVITVDGVGTVAEVGNRIAAALESRGIR